MRHITTLPCSLSAVIVAVSLSITTTIADELSQGVQIDTLTAAECTRPSQRGDVIQVDYRGSLLSTGEEFDNSYDRGKPFSFQLGGGQVIKGWDIALLGMCPGEARRLTIPPELAYGSRGSGNAIPPDSTLVFDTMLVDIVGVKQETHTTSSMLASPTVTLPQEIEEGLTVPTAPAKAVEDFEEFVPQEPGSDKGPLEEGKPKKRCHLLGAFALIVQGALGAFAILTLVWKRYREMPRRPWRIWFFDVSKQVFGSMLTHVLNVGMSMLSSVQLANHAEKFGSQVEAQDDKGRYPNPCSFYLLNLAIDTTLGIPVLYILLIVVHALFLRTPLARPPQSLKSGNYGEPPKTTWYLKQLLIYFIGLTGMKFSVFLLFSALPWLPWVGDWALRWTQFDERLEIAFAMFIFPLAMNAVQYYVIDNLIMDRNRDKTGYEAVHDDEANTEQSRLVGDDSTLDEEDGTFKLDDDEEEEPLKDTGSSGSSSTLKDDTDRKLR